MEKVIKLGFIDKKLERRAPFPLVASDKNAYRLELDISKYPDAKKVFIYAKRADGEVVCDCADAENGKVSYILKQNIYAVEGELSIRLVLSGEEDTILTAAELLLEVLAGNFEGISAEEMSTVEACIIKLSEISDELSLKSDKEYVDTEISAIKADIINKTDKTYVDTANQEILNKFSGVANALSTTRTGTMVCLDDISPIPHTVDVKVKSKNIIPYPFSSAEATRNGITFTPNADQTVTFNGTPTANTSFAIISVNSVKVVKAEKGKTYTISHSGIFPNSSYITLSVLDDKGATVQSVRSSNNGTTFVSQVDGRFTLAFVIVSDVTFNKAKFAVQLEEGDAATQFTQYVDPTTATLTIYGADETDNLQTFEPSIDGKYEVASLSPAMTFMTDNPDVIVEVKYNRDINAFAKDMMNLVAQLKQAIIESGGTV